MPRLDRLLTGSPCSEIHLELHGCEIQAITTFPARFIFIRAASVAAMQERARIPVRIVAVADGDSDFRRKRAQNARLEPPLTVSIVL
jgi:hypothetical protein